VAVRTVHQLQSVLLKQHLFHPTRTVVLPASRVLSSDTFAYGAAILAMVGVGVYPNFDAAFKILPQDTDPVQTQANPMYEAAFKRYKVLYEALKAVR
jgi:sugar (pentulose or hexulose) kinase